MQLPGKFSMKNSLDWWLAMTANLPIARASAVAVHTTSLIAGFTYTWPGEK
jgi:hypothetical protein